MAKKAKESLKPPVFSRLFEERIDAVSGNPKAGVDLVVRSDDVVRAMHDIGSTLSNKNVANFLKDFLRPATRNALWPPAIHAHRWTARQVYGKKQVFEFARYGPSQTEPFPDLFEFSSLKDPHVLESISLTSVARALGREDESWLIQSCVSQRVIETHFAFNSKLHVEDIFHLQNSVKMVPEIDALFLVTFREKKELKKALVTFEAKRDEMILPDQITAQIARMGHICRKKKGFEDIDYVIGLACRSAKVGSGRVIGLFEMKPISVVEAAKHQDANTAHTIPITIAARGAFSFKPSINGI